MSELLNNPVDKKYSKRDIVEQERVKTKISELIVLGFKEEDIRAHKEVNLQKAQYDRYLRMIRKEFLERQLKKRAEFFIHDIMVGKDRLLQNKGYLAAIITDPNATNIEKLEAIKANASLDMTLLKLEYEGTVFLRQLGANQTTPNARNPDLEFLKQQAAIIAGELPTSSTKPIPIPDSTTEIRDAELVTDTERAEEKRERQTITATTASTSNSKTIDSNRVA